MEFCPRCKSVLIPEKRSDTVAFACSRCGYVSEVSQKIVTTFSEPEQSVFVVEKKKRTRSRPKEEYW